jgi:predicted RNase H-like HicB family nuclease
MSIDAEARITLALADGEWFATDEAREITGHGETRAEALEHLDELVAFEEGEIEYSASFAADVETGRKQAARGETRSADEVKRRFGIDG